MLFWSSLPASTRFLLASTPGTSIRLLPSSTLVALTFGGINLGQPVLALL